MHCANIPKSNIEEVGEDTDLGNVALVPVFASGMQWSEAIS